MKTVIKSAAHVAQQITNMERLAPGFAEPFIDFTELRKDEPDKITLVLARDYRAFKDWCNGQQGLGVASGMCRGALRISASIARAVSRLSN